MGSDFKFHAKLYEYRNQAISCLESAGIIVFNDYDCIDIDHAVFGIEICGIKEKAIARKVLDLLRGLFNDLIYSKMEYHSQDREEGWRVVLCREKNVVRVVRVVKTMSSINEKPKEFTLLNSEQISNILDDIAIQAITVINDNEVIPLENIFEIVDNLQNITNSKDYWKKQQ